MNRVKITITYKTKINTDIDAKAIVKANSKKIKVFNNENKRSTDLTLKPWFSNLWEMWSVPPLVGEILFFILCINTVEKSNKGIVKNKKMGAIELYK